MLFVTLGDPYSINVEILLKSIQQGQYLQKMRGFPQIFVGSWVHFVEQMELLGLSQVVPKLQFKVIKNKDEMVRDHHMYFLDINAECDVPNQTQDLTHRDRGAIAVNALKAARDWISHSLSDDDSQMRQPLGLLTMPIHKKHCHTAGWNYPGQTEYFTELSSLETLMMLAPAPASPDDQRSSLRVGLVTNHVAVNQISAVLNRQTVATKLRLLADALLEVFQIQSPRIAVLGLNPHCGDHGLFGREENDIIEPAIEFYKTKRPQSHGQVEVVGPVSADTAFYFAYHKKFDACLAMYHDQGLAPFKLVHFDDGLNLTYGLPFLRVSPDHGPASDLYLKGVASTKSVSACLKLIGDYLQ